jgi:hypothetical protein
MEEIPLPRTAMNSERKIISDTLGSLAEPEELVKPFGLLKNNVKPKSYSSHKEI